MSLASDTAAILGTAGIAPFLRDAPPGSVHPLEAAAIAVRSATDSRGLKIMLMRSDHMFDVVKVAAEIKKVAATLLDDSNVYIGHEGKYTAACHLGLLSNLYAELLKHQTDGARG